MSESTNLLDDFPSISDEEWKEKIISDLRGKLFEDTLLWEDENKITHKPYYRSSDINNQTFIKQIQSAQINSHGLRIVQEFSSSTKKLKTKINEALHGGVDEVVIKNVTDTKATKKNIGEGLKDSHHIHMHLTELAGNTIPKNYFTDPIGEMIEYGKKKEDDLSALSDIFQKRLNQLKPDNFLLINGSNYKNSGASIIQEVALTLHHAVEYLDILTNAGYTAEAIARSFTFKLGIGTSYCSEIAKTRAIRFLITKILHSYDVTSDIKIWGEASPYYLSHKDTYTNLIRLSTQCMSAVLGNCNLISLPSYDHWGEQSSLGYRMSRNIPLILKNESYFNRVNDLTAGSYYIEKLTSEIVKEAWKLFLSIEKEGGLISLLNSGRLVEMIEISKKERNQSYKNEENILVGVNKFFNKESNETEPTLLTKAGLNNAILSKDIQE